jgi:hypothetical protein
MDRLTCCDTVNNNIGAKGVKYLSRADWKALEELNVGIKTVN